MIFIMKTNGKNGICKVQIHTKRSTNYKFIHIQISANEVDVNDFAFARDREIAYLVKNHTSDDIIEVISKLKHPNYIYYCINTNEATAIRKLKFTRVKEPIVAGRYSEKIKKELKAQRGILIV